MPSHHLASLIRAAARARPDHPCDPEETAHRLGYRVVWIEPGRMGGAVGMVIRDELHVARSGIVTRDRWTLAHELAHAHARRWGLPWRDERIVDQAAAELLLPAALVARHLSAGLDLPRLAAQCGTSLEATARRTIEIAPGVAAADYGEHARCYSTLPAGSHRLSRLAAALAGRARAHGRAKRIRLPAWVARAWSGPEAGAGVSVILRG